eukprot:COSAG01_NODE_57703_length_310_cov_1.469194_2_plen_51_part_01
MAGEDACVQLTFGDERAEGLPAGTVEVTVDGVVWRILNFAGVLAHGDGERV